MTDIDIEMTCGRCGEELLASEECKCPGSAYCTCEFEHHHYGCCESFEELVEHFTHDNPAKDEGDATTDIEQEVLDAHDEYAL